MVLVVLWAFFNRFNRLLLKQTQSRSFRILRILEFRGTGIEQTGRYAPREPSENHDAY